MSDRDITISVKQVGRWTWKATVSRGVIVYGEFGGPYAMTRKRCIAKARRVERKLRQRSERATRTTERVSP